MATNGTGAIPIDGDLVPRGDGSTEPNHVTRDLEVVLEEEIAAIVEYEQRASSTGPIGRRLAFVRMIMRLRRLRLSLEEKQA